MTSVILIRKSNVGARMLIEAFGQYVDRPAAEAEAITLGLGTRYGSEVALHVGIYIIRQEDLRHQLLPGTDWRVLEPGDRAAAAKKG